MTIPTTIFIDTCIFDDSAYNFDSERFKVFKPLAKTLSLRLLIPDPTDREIKRHIHERSQSAIKSLEDAVKRTPFLARLENWPLNKKNNNMLAYNLEELINKGLSEFYKNFEIKRLNYRNVDLREVMNWYEWEQAPFSGRKKNEFPDAFSIAALNEYHKNHNENIAIISRDDDFKSACAIHKHFLYYPSLPAYTEAIQGEDETIDRIHKIISDDDSMIRKSISESFSELSFLIEANWEGEAEDIELTHFHNIEYYIVGVGHHNFIISFDAEVSFSAYVSYWDLETAVYDKGEAYPLHKIEGQTESNVSISGTCKITTDEGETKLATCNSVVFEQDYISIGNGFDY